MALKSFNASSGSVLSFMKWHFIRIITSCVFLLHCYHCCRFFFRTNSIHFIQYGYANDSLCIFNVKFIFILFEARKRIFSVVLFYFHLFPTQRCNLFCFIFHFFFCDVKSVGRHSLLTNYMMHYTI